MMKKHRKEMLDLEKEDPEFFKELQNEGKELLDFDDDDDDDGEDDVDLDFEGDDDDNGDAVGDDDLEEDDQEMDEDLDDDDELDDEEDEEDDDEEDGKAKKKKKKPAKKEDVQKEKKKLTEEMVKEILTNAKNGAGMTAYKRLIHLFGSACQSTNPDSKKEGAYYAIVTSSIYQMTMTGCLSIFDEATEKCLWPSGEKSSKKDRLVPKSSKHWQKYSLYIKRFLGLFIRLLESTTEPTMIRYMLTESRGFMKYYLSLPPLMSRLILKVLVKVWSGLRTDTKKPSKKKSRRDDDENNDEKEEEDGDSLQVGLSAYLRIRQLAQLDNGLLDRAVRDCYIQFVRGSKFSNAFAATRLAMQARCIVDLVATDASTSYELAFVFIRKMALMLHDAITSKTVEALKMVCSWQFVHSLRIWASVLCTYAGSAGSAYIPNNKSTTLDPLVYPLVQVILGTMNLVPTEKSAPLRLHLCALLVKLEQHTHVYIPVGHYLGVILQSKVFFGEKPLGSTKKPLDIEHTLRLKKDEIRLTHSLESIVNKTLGLLKEHLDVFKTHVAYPELAISATASLREFAKTTRISKWRVSAKTLLKEVEEFYVVSLRNRSKAKLSPSNPAHIEQFRKTMQEVVEKSTKDKEKSDFILDLFATNAAGAEKEEHEENDDGREIDESMSKKEKKKLKRKQEREKTRGESEKSSKKQKTGSRDSEEQDSVNSNENEDENIKDDAEEDGSEDEVEDLDWSKF